jgi:hypothetical protein
MRARGWGADLGQLSERAGARDARRLPRETNSDEYRRLSKHEILDSNLPRGEFDINIEGGVKSHSLPSLSC